MLNRKDLLEKVSDRIKEDTYVSKKDANIIVGHFLNSLITSVEGGEEVRLNGIGTFKKVVLPAREYRNPKTGETVFKDERTTTKFKISKNLK